MAFKKSRIWSERETKYLKYNYSYENREMLERVLGRTWRAIQSKACELGLGAKKTRWSSEQIQYLKKYYNVKPRKILMRELGKTWKSIKIQASRQGLTKKSNVKEYASFAILTVRKKDIERKFKIDLKDAERVRNRVWYLQQSNRTGRYYAITKNDDDKVIKLGRFILGIRTNKKVSYKNGNIEDNRRKNLFLTDNSLLQYRKTTPNKNSKSKKRGVIYCKDLKKWRVEFKINGKTKYFGVFKTKEMAEKMAKAVRKRIIEKKAGR